jgi:hypothetical protein
VTSPVIDRVRAHVYRAFAASGVAPSFRDIAEALNEPASSVESAISELSDRHLFVLSPDGRSIERALPFSAVPTPFHVRAGRQSWWANCIWDALGLAPLLGRPTVVETACADCAAAVSLAVDPGEGPDLTWLVAHVLLPASRWYDDLRYT